MHRRRKSPKPDPETEALIAESAAHREALRLAWERAQERDPDAVPRLGDPPLLEVSARVRERDGLERELARVWAAVAHEEPPWDDPARASALASVVAALRRAQALVEVERRIVRLLGPESHEAAREARQSARAALEGFGVPTGGPGTSAGVRDALADAWQRLEHATIEPTSARALALLARQLLAVADERAGDELARLKREQRAR